MRTVAQLNGVAKVPEAAWCATDELVECLAMKQFIYVVGVMVLAGIAASATYAADAPTAKDGVLVSEGFEDAKLQDRGWYDGAQFRIVDAAKVGNGCIEYEWTTAGGGVSGSQSVRHLFEPTDEIYLRYYIKFSKGWGWSGRDYHPHMTHFMTTENPPFHGPAGSHLTTYLEPVNGKLRLALTDIQNKDARHGLTQGPLKGGYNGMMYDSKEVVFVDDQWHCVEAQYKLNTLDMANDKPNADGILRGWFDGKLVVEHTDVILRSTDFPKMKFNQFVMAPYFGPGLVPHPQKLWIDELVISTKPIGPLPAGKKD